MNKNAVTFFLKKQPLDINTKCFKQDSSLQCNNAAADRGSGTVHWTKRNSRREISRTADHTRGELDQISPAIAIK